MKIAVFGKRGSFTEEAANSYCSKFTRKPKYIFRDNASGIFAAVYKSKANVGIVPISNATAGVVDDTVKAMSKYSFRTIKLYEIGISHNLLCRKEADPTRINKIVSHPQALSQCRLYLSRKWLTAKKIPYSSTSSAAKDLASGKLPATCAVIASSKAADIYSLRTLAKNIQDTKTNSTQFLVFDKALLKTRLHDPIS